MVLGKSSNLNRLDYGNVCLGCTCTKPPLGLFFYLKTCLRWIDQDDLQEIERIVISDRLPDYVTDDVSVMGLRGYYTCPTNDSPPTIFLATAEINKCLPLCLRWGPMAILLLNRTLAHEVGHHVTFMREGEVLSAGMHEDKASKYARKVINAMEKRWYYALAQWLIKDLAGWYFAFGLAAAKNKRYERAANRFYIAWCLNPELEDAADYYWLARDKTQQSAQKGEADL